MSPVKSIMLTTSLLIGCVSLSAHVKMTKPRVVVVAVIDTGLAEDLLNSKFLCDTGHKDFTGTGLADNQGHGTHVSGLIDQYAKGLTIGKANMKHIISTSANYCQVILKFYDPKQKNPDAMEQELQALRTAIELKVDIINFSGGGTQYNATEAFLIKKALNLGIKVVVAAGNEGSDLDKVPYFPACVDNRLYVVGNMTEPNTMAESSNYGNKVNTWEYGTNVISYGTKDRIAIMTGTSQSAAIKSGKLIREMLNSK